MILLSGSHSDKNIASATKVFIRSKYPDFINPTGVGLLSRVIERQHLKYNIFELKFAILKKEWLQILV